jgi:hypothetical protein
MVGILSQVVYKVNIYLTLEASASIKSPFAVQKLGSLKFPFFGHGMGEPAGS